MADLRFARFVGFPAWLVWAGIHIYFLIGFANRLFVSLQWGIAFLTKRRRVRILPKEFASARDWNRSSSLIFAKAPFTASCRITIIA